MYALGSIHHKRKDHEQALGWFTMAAKAGLMESMYDFACMLEKGEGIAAGAYTRPHLSST